MFETVLWILSFSTSRLSLLVRIAVSSIWIGNLSSSIGNVSDTQLLGGLERFTLIIWIVMTNEVDIFTCLNAFVGIF